MTNAMLLSSKLPQNLWGDAILFANYIFNRIPQKKTNKTPYELWKGKIPTYKYLKVWGCLAKVEPKTADCVFIGYAQNSCLYRFLIHKFEIPDMHPNTIIELRTASFFEFVFPNKPLQDQVLLKELVILLVAIVKTNKRLMNLDEVRGLEHKKHLVQIFKHFCQKMSLKALKKRCPISRHHIEKRQ